jgi:hypothetical protein
LVQIQNKGNISKQIVSPQKESSIIISDNTHTLRLSLNRNKRTEKIPAAYCQERNVRSATEILIADSDKSEKEKKINLM